ncbi:MAG: PspA/IM30 family protein [Candidatus Obscuribacterales bacterium]|nr:PspA/IM30 family protein [Candidatus Obscuribacterales bacterium]
MFDRLKSILNGMFNKGMAKMETPEVLAEQAEMELESNFKKISESLTSGMANEKMLEKKIQANNEQLSQWEKRAMMAVQQGNDDMARQCLAKKQELVQTSQAFEAQIQEQKKANARMKDAHTELQNKLREFRSKKNEMLARAKASDSVAKANEIVSGASGSSMDKWEQKIAQKEAMSQAMNEMSGNSRADAEFKEWDKQAGLDDELAALKSSMGTGPKLVEAKREMVDENLPMIVDAEIEDDSDSKK